MVRTCPQCKSRDVRRSSSRVPQAPVHHLLLSRYRCRACRERFWVVSENTYYLAAIAGAVILIAGLVWGVQIIFKNRPAQASAPVADSYAEIVKRAQKDDPLAQYKLAQIYRKGDGVSQSDQEALNWLQRSAQAGNPDAQFELGIALRDGDAVVQDFQEAVRWLRSAAEGGNPDAQYELGLMYQSGWGIPQDNVKAYTLFNLAAARGVKGAGYRRDAVVRLLSPAQVNEAQVEARRLSEADSKRPAATDALVQPNAQSN